MISSYVLATPSEQVSLFLRRIGLKQYVQIFLNYNVNGRTLMLLDAEDYENLYITSTIHIRKIQVEIQRIYRHSGPALHQAEDHIARREKIRRQKMYHAAAIMVQKHFRIFSAKRKASLLRELRRLALEAEETRRRLAEGNVWYTDNDNLPVKNTAVAQGWVEKNGLKLPPIKTFGRNRDFLSHKGWGRWSDGKEREWLPSPAAVMVKNHAPDAHISRIFVEKLHINGYDEKRMLEFRNSQTGLKNL
jgi:hypothetical protein